MTREILGRTGEVRKTQRFSHPGPYSSSALVLAASCLGSSLLPAVQTVCSRQRPLQHLRCDKDDRMSEREREQNRVTNHHFRGDAARHSREPRSRQWRGYNRCCCCRLLCLFRFCHASDLPICCGFFSRRTYSVLQGCMQTDCESGIFATLHGAVRPQLTNARWTSAPPSPGLLFKAVSKSTMLWSR